jgi:hypothetical protein
MDKSHVNDIPLKGGREDIDMDKCFNDNTFEEGGKRNL